MYLPMAPTSSGPAERTQLVIDSFPAQLAAPAVLRRPDVFHAAVAGAPVTDWRLYDTHASEAAHEQVAGNMLLLQRDFLREALARGGR